jgi:diguanylate cyclase (GGDEF)-like protein
VAVFVRGGFALHENMRLIQAREEALTDELTGLANRRGFYLRVPDLLHGEPPHAVLVADLDRFKDVNDRLGHQAGDDVLRDAARRLRAALPDAAMLARLGGDEFAAVVELRGEAALAQLRARLTDLLVTPFATPAPGLSVSASVGVAPVPRGERDVDDLLRRADAAMYAAKRAGIGVRVAAPGGRRRDWLAPQLEAALDRGELVLHYQPQMEIATGRVAAVEALVRWQHPERGLLAPDAFLPLAEGAGLLGRLTRRVLRDALDQRRAWAAAGHDLPVAVNLGAGDVLDRTLPGELSALLDGTATSPDRLHLELSERVALQGAGRAPDVLAGLRGLGVSLALTRGAAGDEAEGRGRGTAGSSPLDLEQLGADALKLDRTLVAGLPDDPDSLRVVRSAIALARELGLRVIAEGVERAEELAALAGLGCELAQGYHLSRPLPPEELEAWLDAPQLAFAQRSSRGSSASATTRSTAAGRQGPSSSAASSR